MADGVDPDELAVPGQLHRPGHDGHVDGGAGPLPPARVAGAGEADHPGTIGQAGDHQPGGGIAGPAGPQDAWLAVSLVLAEPLGVGGHDHPGVQDVGRRQNFQLRACPAAASSRSLLPCGCAKAALIAAWCASNPVSAAMAGSTLGRRRAARCFGYLSPSAKGALSEAASTARGVAASDPHVQVGS